MKVVVATSLYEAALPYLGAWIAGVLAAAAAAPECDVGVAVAADGLAHPDAAHEAVAARFNTAWRVCAAGATVAGVRRDMIALSRESGDAVVFCDADDVLTPESIRTHVATLADADVSVGDLVPVDATGKALRPAMFGAALPEAIDAGVLAERNFCGFSNTAARRSVLEKLPARFPDVVAVDWLVFASLADAGARMRSTRVPVALYRQHGANTLGAGTAVTVADARRRMLIVAAHHRARGDDALAMRAERLAGAPGRLEGILATAATAGPAWHADVAAWLDSADKEMNS